MQRLLLSLLLCLALGTCGHLVPAHHQTTERAELRAGTYSLDPEHAVLLWKIDHLGFSTFVGRFDRLAGSLDFDPDRPTEAVLDVLVETASVSTHLADLTTELRYAAWLDAERYPEARFVSRRIAVTGPAAGRIEGELTLKGVTRPVTLEVTFNGGARNFVTGRYTLGFAGSAVIDRTVFGISTLAPAIGREVVLEIHAEFVATGS